MHPEQPSEVEQLWLANEAFVNLKWQHVTGQDLDPGLVDQFNANRDAYESVGGRVLAELTEVAPEYRSKVLRSVALDAVRETSRDQNETEDDICMRALTKLLDVNTTSYTKRLEEFQQRGDAELCELLRQDDSWAAHALVERYHLFVDMKAGQLASKHPLGRDLEADLKQIGIVAFLRYAKRWNDDGTAKLMSYAGDCAVGAMRSWLTANGYPVYLPGPQAERLKKIEAINSDRVSEGKRFLTDKEIARKFKMPLSNPSQKVSVFDLRQAGRLTHLMGSLEAGYSPRVQSSYRDPYFIDKNKKLTSVTTEQPPKDPADEAIESELKSAIRTALATLSEREAGVIRLRYGLEDGRPRTLEEIGEVYGVTRERIRQIDSKALRKLRHPSRADMVRDFLK